MKRVFWLAFVPLAWGCTNDKIPAGEIAIFGGEIGVWTEEPRPTSLGVTIRQVGSDQASPYTTLAVPTQDAEEPVFSMGHGYEAVFEATATDAGGKPLVKGRTWRLDRGSLVGYRVGMFVGRVGEFSRPPSPFTTALGDFPPVAMYAGEFLISLGIVENQRIRLDGYDLGLWESTTGSVPCLGDPCQVKSAAVVDMAMIAMVSDTWAGWSYPDSTGVWPLPDGWSSWADVAGGAAVYDLDNDGAYIVGATRPENPTTAVLYVLGNKYRALNLLKPRAGAAATWIKGVGLVVVGGSSDATSAGVEVLTDYDSKFSTRAFPADGTTGAGLVAIDGSTVLRAGGSLDGSPAPTVSLALGCGDSCQPDPTGDPLDLVRPRGFKLDSGDTFWIGNDAAGETAARTLGASSGRTPVELRQPRIGGSVLEVSTGQIAVLGGHQSDGSPALDLEFYQP